MRKLKSGNDDSGQPHASIISKNWMMIMMMMAAAAAAAAVAVEAIACRACVTRPFLPDSHHQTRADLVPEKEPVI